MLNLFTGPPYLEDRDTIGRLHTDEESDYIESDDQDSIDHQSTDPETYVGDTLQENKPQGCIRIYCINLNGIKWDQDGGTWPNICQAIEASNVDIAGLVELNLDTGRYELQQKLECICNDTFHHHHMIMSTSKYKVSKTYKPGGTAVIACNDMKALVKSWSRDRMGRWSAIRFSGSEGNYFTFIMAYQVCKTSSKGTNTAAAQQRANIIEESIQEDVLTRPSPRQAFITDLRQFIQATQQAGDNIILCGDFNETMSESHSGMATLAEACGLVDIFNIRLGTSDSPPTYQRGKRRLDYILMSPSLISAVRAAGYDPFGYRIVSDHRGYYVDLDVNILCGITPTKLAPVDHRDFQSTNPHQLRTYLKIKHQYLRNHQWYERLQHLMEKQAPDDEIAEALDRDLQRSSRCAANACKFSYRSPWSPTFAQAWATINFYKLAKSQITNAQDYTAAIHRLQKNFPSLPKAIPHDPIIITTRYRQALSTLHRVRQDARSLRDTYLQEKAALYTHLEEKGKANIVKRIQRAERTSQIFKKIQFIRQNGHPKGLVNIKIPCDPTIINNETMKTLPDNTDTWQTVRIPEEIEKLLLDRNQRHFGQADGTPFTRQPLSMDVRYDGSGIRAEAILEGSYDTSTMTKPTALFIQHLQQKSLKTLDKTITTNDIIEKLKNWPERTTTSPSGTHLGHYHAMWRPTGCRGGEEDPEGQEINDAQEALQKGHTQLLEYALKNRYAFQRWSDVVNIMLEKDPGNPRIHRLRVIHIYEADYNLLLAVKWRQALHHAEDTNIINKGLYGSRPGRSAITPVNIEIMQHAIYQLSMKSGINLDLDATSCYDRILAKVANLSSRRMGMNASVVLVNCQTLEQARFRIKTTMGVSKNWYTHSDAFPIHGTGQGSGNSPTIWCFVCSALFDALESTATGAQFTSPNRKYSIRLHMIGFVDDCSQRVNRFNDHPQPSNEKLVQIMQQEAQLWNDLLWTSGGALEQTKCSYHLIHTEWNAKGLPYLSATTTAPPLILKKPNGQETKVTQLSNYQAHRTLGCYIEPAMTMHTQTKVLRSKNDQFAKLLQTNYFSRTETWTLYSSVYIPSMTYPFPNIILKETFADKLDQTFMPLLVSHCGYNQKMAKAIRYAPRPMGGAGFRPLYVEWGSATVLEIMKNLREPTSYQGNMTMIALMWAQQYVGTSKFLLDDVNSAIPSCPNPYIMAVRSFLRTIQAQIQVQETMISPLLRANDKYLMDLAMQHGWTIKKVDSINACRRYLQATTLADISNDRGTEIDEEVWLGTRTVDQETYRDVMFNQARPNSSAWGQWRSFLRTLCKGNCRLINPLGKWTVPHALVRHPTPWVYNAQEDRLYKRLHRKAYTELQKQAPKLFRDIQQTSQHQQPEGYPTWVRHTSTGIQPMHAFNQPIPAPQTTQTFPEYINGLEAWEKQLLQNCRLNYPPTEIMHRLNAGPITSGSDGSVRNPLSTFGFVICDHQKNRLIQGHGPASGSDPTSLRSEAYGALATFQCLLRLSAYTKIPIHSAITHVVDNKSLIRRINEIKQCKHESPSLTLKAEWDVIREIVTSIGKFHQTPQYQWEKSHQDRTVEYSKLSHMAQLNCDADALAGKYYRQMNQTTTHVLPLPTNPVTLLIAKSPITRKYRQKIREAHAKPALYSHLCKRFKWEPSVPDTIAWDIFTSIIQHFQNNHTTIVKHVHAIAPTGHIAHRNCPHLTAQCPSCQCEREDNNHVILCPATTREAWRKTTLETITNAKLHRSDPILKTLIHEGLNNFHNNKGGLNEENYPAQYSTLIHQQNTIGWDQLYRGRWSKEWSRLHRMYAGSQLAWEAQEQEGSKWVTYHGTILLQRWMKLWTLRNQERHGEDQQAHHRNRYTILLKELTTLYELRNEVTPRDRSIFFSSVAQHMEAKPDLNNIEDWIHTHRTAIRASAQQAQQHGIQRNRTIKEFFKRSTNVPDKGPPALARRHP